MQVGEEELKTRVGMVASDFVFYNYSYNFTCLSDFFPAQYWSKHLDNDQCYCKDLVQFPAKLCSLCFQIKRSVILYTA